MGRPPKPHTPSVGVKDTGDASWGAEPFKMPKKKWIAKATEKSHGQFRAKAERAGETTREFADQHKGDSDKTGKQARLALALMGTGKRRSKLYDHPRSPRSE